MNEVVVIDYGVGNLLSVKRALEQIDVNVKLSRDVDEIRLASKILLPGVGAFDKAYEELVSLGLVQSLKDAAARGTYILGICVGMQLLFDCSEEFGYSQGLGLIPGSVVKIPLLGEGGVSRKIPHIGWGSLIRPGGRNDWQCDLLEHIHVGSYMYFIHSFVAKPLNDDDCIALCDHEGELVTAVVMRDNIFGFQFHPEKSGTVGLSLLRRFVNL